MSIYISPDSAAWSLTAMATAASTGSTADEKGMSNLIREIYESGGFDALSGVIFALAHHNNLSLHALATATGISSEELLEIRRHAGPTFKRFPAETAPRFEGWTPLVQPELEVLPDKPRV